jgi:hypothetical protein
LCDPQASNPIDNVKTKIQNKEDMQAETAENMEERSAAR